MLGVGLQHSAWGSISDAFGTTVASHEYYATSYLIRGRHKQSFLPFSMFKIIFNDKKSFFEIGETI